MAGQYQHSGQFDSHLIRRAYRRVSLGASVAVFIGVVLGYLVVKLGAPAWEGLLDRVTANWRPPSQQEIDRLVNSPRTSVIVLLIAFLPWVVFFVITLADALLVGKLCSDIAVHGKVRSVRLAALLALGAAVVPAAIAWLCVGALYAGSMETVISVHRLLLVGGILLSSALFAAVEIAHAVFCERCQRWCDKKHVVSLDTSERPAMLRRQLRSQGVDVLLRSGPSAKGARRWLEIIAHSCAGCRTALTVSVGYCTKTIDSKGESSESTRFLVRRMLVTSHQFQTLCDIARSGEPALPARR
jgi:hypothetical protein